METGSDKPTKTVCCISFLKSANEDASQSVHLSDIKEDSGICFDTFVSEKHSVIQGGVLNRTLK